MKKVITYGTFDLFHIGHYNILKRAKAFGDYLIVGVTGENYDIERGKIGVQDSLATRIENVKKTGFADEIIIEEFQGQKVQDVQKYGIDTFVIGSDWLGKFEYLKPYCNVVYLERTRDISSTQIRLDSQNVCVGLILDGMSDDDFVEESKYVSGVHVDSVFSKYMQTAECVKEKFELNGAYSSLETFFDCINTVYIHGNGRSNLEYIRPALEAGKHVLFSFPAFIREEEFRSLTELAEKKNVLLLPCAKMAYSQALNQMFWMIESGNVGDILNMRCSVTQKDMRDMTLAVCNALYVFCKLFGKKDAAFHSFKKKLSGDSDDKFYYCLQANMKDASALVEISNSIDITNRLTICGSRGVIAIPDEWWNSGYFKIAVPGNDKNRRYCYNYAGTGLRYVLQQMLIMLREKQTKPIKFSYDDFAAFNRLYEKISRA